MCERSVRLQKAAALKETLTQQRRTERDMASMRTLAHAMNSIQMGPGRSGNLGGEGGVSNGLAGAQSALADLEVEVFKDMVRCYLLRRCLYFYSRD